VNSIENCIRYWLQFIWKGYFIDLQIYKTSKKKKKKKKLHNFPLHYFFSFVARNTANMIELSLAPTNSLFERLEIDVIYATIPKTKERRSRTSYTIQVLDKQTNRHITIRKFYSDFEKLKKQMCQVLNHGSFCSDSCVCFWMDIYRRFPRKYEIRSQHPNVVSKRLNAFREILQTALAFVKSPEVHTCTSMDDLNEMLLEFIFQTDEVSRLLAFLPSINENSNDSGRSTFSSSRSLLHFHLSERGSNTFEPVEFKSHRIGTIAA